jgi:hypothetical protein
VDRQPGGRRDVERGEVDHELPAQEGEYELPLRWERSIIRIREHLGPRKMLDYVVDPEPVIAPCVAIDNVKEY